MMTTSVETPYDLHWKLYYNKPDANIFNEDDGASDNDKLVIRQIFYKVDMNNIFCAYKCNVNDPINEDTFTECVETGCDWLLKQSDLMNCELFRELAIDLANVYLRTESDAYSEYFDTMGELKKSLTEMQEHDRLMLGLTLLHTYEFLQYTYPFIVNRLNNEITEENSSDLLEQIKAKITLQSV